MNDRRIREIMARAVAIARNGGPAVYPNPMVGAVIFDDTGTILAEGWHRCCGGDHAEVDALKNLGRSAAGLSMAVTLEPCNHFGRTPPCSHALLAAGIRKVYIAAHEPTEKACGGCDYLAAHGIPTEFVPGFEAELAELNRFFHKTARARRPWVTLKMALTMDGFIAPPAGGPFPISGEESRREVHHLRAEHMAIAVGAGTANCDDPLLTVRLVEGRNPQPVIFSATLSLESNRKILDRSPIIFTKEDSPARHDPFVARGCRLETLSSPDDLSPALSLLWEKYRLNSLLVEGGARLYRSFLEQGLADEIVHFIAPFTLGDGISLAGNATNQPTRFRLHSLERFGDDVKVVWRP